MRSTVNREEVIEAAGLGRVGFRCREWSLRRRATSIVLVSVFLAPVAAMAVDWPAWRGPHRDGTSPETNLPISWSHEESVVWRIDVPGVSGATPIISGDHVFVHVGDGEQLALWAVKRTDGSLLWRRSLGDGNRKARKHNMSSPSPVTDGEHVWVLTGTGVLKAFDFDGEELWGRNLQDDYGTFGLNWGYASSPLLADGKLFVQVLHGMKTDDPSYVLAIDAKTGETLWRVERPTDAVAESPDSYTTPAIWGEGDSRELLITGGDYATGHSLVDGRELWRVGGFNPDNRPFYRVVASAVVADSRVFVPSRVKPLMALERQGAGEEPKVAWSIERGTDVPTPVVVDGVFYLVDDRGLMSARDAATGEVFYENQRLRTGTYSGSPVAADGKLYITNEDAVTSVVRLGKTFELLAENEVEGFALSSPAIAQGQLFLRTEGNLYCIGVQ